MKKTQVYEWHKYFRNGHATDVFIVQDNASAHRSLVVKKYLAKNNATALDHPPCSPATLKRMLCKQIFLCNKPIPGTF
jgi:hypothetical protein